MADLTVRPARPEDAEAIALIYNQGIEDRVATFETRPRTREDVLGWLDGRHPVVVVEDGGEIIAFASTSTYRPRECYDGIAEFSVYVDRGHKGHGTGRAAMLSLIEQAERAARRADAELWTPACRWRSTSSNSGWISSRPAALR